jgi:hypothetical protein
MIAPMPCEYNADARRFSSHTPIHYTALLVCGSTRMDFFSGFTRQRVGISFCKENGARRNTNGRRKIKVITWLRRLPLPENVPMLPPVSVHATASAVLDPWRER